MKLLIEEVAVLEFKVIVKRVRDELGLQFDHYLLKKKGIDIAQA